MSQIAYRSGYKYQLAQDYQLKIKIVPDSDITTQFIDLDSTGLLTVKSGYAWDGPSGPVVDRKENMRASLVHDALYQLMRQSHLSADQYKKKSDKLFKKICIEDGIDKITAKAYYAGLAIGGDPATRPENQKKVHLAPESIVA